MGSGMLESASVYLQALAEIFRIWKEPGVFVSFIKPGAAPDFGGSLLPIHSVPLPLLDMDIIPLAFHSHHHLFFLFSYCTVNTQTQFSSNSRIKGLILICKIL